MDQPRRVVGPYFSQPIRQIAMMLIVLAAFGFGAYVAFPRVAPVFLANLYLNGFIAFVFVIGLFAVFWQSVELIKSVSWIETFARRETVPEGRRPSRLLAPLAHLMRTRGARMHISSTSARSILDSVGARIDEARDITRYIANLLVFLGLLGTFFGLATTIPAVVETIRSLAPAEGEGGVEVFSRLMTGLENQLGGMGTAFSSSLLGLTGSLIIGLLELFASHGQNRFYGELEEWLSTITRLGYASGDGDADGDRGVDSSAVGALVEAVSKQVESMQALVDSSEAGRGAADARLSQVAQSLERLAQRMDAGESPTASLRRVAEGQEKLIALLSARTEEGGTQVDAESRMRLRSIDVQLLRILEEMSAGRQESLAELRTDLAALTRVIRQLAREPAATTPPAPVQARRG